MIDLAAQININCFMNIVRARSSFTSALNMIDGGSPMLSISEIIQILKSVTDLAAWPRITKILRLPISE